MTDFLPGLGALTLSGSLVIGVLILISRSPGTRYGARWRCWAWLALCLRLALPITLFPLDQMGRDQPLIQLPAPSDTVIYHRPAPQPPANQSDSRPGTDQDSLLPPAMPGPFAPQLPVQPESESVSLSLSQALTLLWLGGGALFLLWSLTAHLRFLSYLGRWAVPVSHPQTIALYNQLGDRLDLDRRPRLMVCPGLQAPMLAGLLRPVLLLPQGELTKTASYYALLHELTHFRRRDIWLKALALWVNAVHWFNPLVWYMVRLVERDTELACDEDALRRLPQAEHAAYGRTILDAAERLMGNS